MSDEQKNQTLTLIPTDTTNIISTHSTNDESFYEVSTNDESSIYDKLT
jgi:hypothetical protein